MTAVVDTAPHQTSPAIQRPERDALEAVFRAKYGDPEATGWSPRMRWRFGYFSPDEHYEALVDSLVTPETRWMDVGCGRDLFPNNKTLARELADRCKLLVGVDPDVTIEENPFVHEAIRSPIDTFRSEHRFDLVTMRMVAEHVQDPAEVVETLRQCVAPGGLAIIFTVHKFSPVPLMTSLVPFGMRHPIKKFLWRTEAKDTFPTCFRMNTQATLKRQFEAGGFEEAFYEALDDCRTLARFKAGQWLELTARRVFRGVGVGYVERCIMAAYRRSR